MASVTVLDSQTRGRACQIDPWIGLAFIAAATERLYLGTTVSQIALRDPVLDGPRAGHAGYPSREAG